MSDKTFLLLKTLDQHEQNQHLASLGMPESSPGRASACGQGKGGLGVSAYTAAPGAAVQAGWNNHLYKASTQ